MTEVDIPDAKGNLYKCREVWGELYPGFKEESIRHVNTMEARPDDLYICAYPKSGTHWIYQIVRYLLAGTTDLPVNEKDEAFLEATPPNTINALASPRNLNTHFNFHRLSPDILRNKCKIIHILRDPRDVLVSDYYHHQNGLSKYKGEFNDFFELVMNGIAKYGPWTEHTKGWEKGVADNPDHPIYVMTYEAMKQEPSKEVRRLAVFLDVQCSDELVDAVVEKTSIGAMQKERAGPGTDDKKVMPRMYRKGKSGDWKNHFTVAQVERYNEMFEEKMAGTKAYHLYSHSGKL